MIDGDYMNEKYKHFGLVGLDGRYQSELSQETGKECIDKLNAVTEKIKQRALRAKASWESAHASETALKAFLIYTDLIKMPCFTHTKEERDTFIDKRGNQQYSYYPKMNGEDLGGVWRLLLDGKREALSLSDMSKFVDPKFGIIGNPHVLLTEIQQHAIPGDFRKDADYMRIDSVHAYNSRDRITGHDLFAYLKLQSPEIQTLINNDFFLLGDKVSKEEKIIGILEGLSNDSSQNYTNQEFVSKNARAFETRRFDWITGEEIEDKDLKVIEDFADINNGILKFKFPDEDILTWIYKQDYSQFDSTVFSLLDPILKYYVKEMFSQEEINTIDSIAKVNHLNPSDATIFVNMCVYYKYYIKEIIKDRSSILDFDKANHAENILKHSANMKQYDVNGNEKLEDDTRFISNLSSIKEIQEQIDNYNNEKNNEEKVSRIITSPDGKKHMSLSREELDTLFDFDFEGVNDILDMVKYRESLKEKLLDFYDGGHDEEAKEIEEEINKINNFVHGKYSIAPRIRNVVEFMEKNNIRNLTPGEYISKKHDAILNGFLRETLDDMFNNEDNNQNESDFEEMTDENKSKIRK